MRNETINKQTTGQGVELFIYNNNEEIQLPVVDDIVTLDQVIEGKPAKLTFKVHNDEVAFFHEGNPTYLRYNGVNMFFGFIFTKKRNKEDIITVTAYDKTRYLQAKDTLQYENKTASQVISFIYTKAGFIDGKLDLVNTGYVIPKRIEENKSYMDIMQEALGQTLENTGEFYCLYDDFGVLTLRNLNDMALDSIYIDESQAEDFDYETTIDREVYNRIKLIREDKEEETREVVIVEDSNTQEEWGVLQYFNSISEDIDIKAKANALLFLHNRKGRKLTIKGVFGDTNVKPYSLIPINMHLGDIVQNSYLIVKSVKHIFQNGEYKMDLELMGGILHG